jgi:hypothetical protein
MEWANAPEPRVAFSNLRGFARLQALWEHAVFGGATC